MNAVVKRKINGAAAGNVNAGAALLADDAALVCFTVPTPPSVNEIYKNVPGRGRVKAEVYDKFIAMCLASIRMQRVRRLNGNVLAIFGVERMSLSADIDNRLKAMLDAIVKAGIIQDDSLVTGIAVSWLPKANGMAHVMLLPVQKLDLSFRPSTNGATGGWYLNAPSNEEEPDDGDFS